MKFLVMGKVKDIFFTLPPGLARQLAETTVAVMNEQKKQGKILEYYDIQGGARSVAIVENTTGEDMAKVFGEIPLASYMDFEIYPLADFNKSMKIAIEGLKEAEKMMPGATK